MEGLDANRPSSGGDQLESPPLGQHSRGPALGMIQERPTSAGGTSQRVAIRTTGFEPPSTYRSREYEPTPFDLQN